MAINTIMTPHTTTRSSFLALCFLSLFAVPSSSDDKTYAESLWKFKQSLTNAGMLDNWQEPVPDHLCISKTVPVWTGCVCNNSIFIGLRLENMSLSGKIDVESLSSLPILSFSVMNNSFSGPFPSDINKIGFGKLRSLYLANNSFSGDVPDDAFSGMTSMRKVVMGYNLFSGKIPMSLLKLPKLVQLELQNNQFDGRIPDFWQANLTVNFANNRLEGSIPDTLRNQNASSFLGNNLCGKPLNPCKPKELIPKIAVIIISAAGASLAIFIILFLLCRRRSKPLKYEKSVEHFQKEEELKAESTKGSAVIYKTAASEHGKLYFVREDRVRFELEDLLRASAEVLGSGSFGSSYKAIFSSEQTYMVRRFRQMSNVGKEEFYEHMKRLGKVTHHNLLPLVAFYYRKEEKLLITDFVAKGSLASHLHGKRSPNQPGLDWPTRLRIIKGVARGLSHLHNQLPTLTLPHGHLKSSNVLLDSTLEPLLSEYALSPLINKDHAVEFMVAHKSPESTQKGGSASAAVNRKTDVWSLGILILEVLTGRFPGNYLKRGKGTNADLATWVNAVVREEWTGEVFDKEMMGSARNGGEGQMLRMLKIGMCCCEWSVEKRWDLTEAVERIEELKERESAGDDDYSSNYATSDGDVYYSSREMTDDDFSFSRAS